MRIAKNYLYNLTYQVFTLLIPLITIPYISRVLGSEGVGINAFTNSIVQYFVLIGSVGISTYGNRKVAYVKDNRQDLQRTFWSIFWLKIFTTSFAYGLFVLFLIVTTEYHTIFLIQSLYIISAMLDITWLYMGLEDFKKTVLRNLIVKISGTIAIFMFVKGEDDLWKYVLLLSLSEVIGHLTVYSYLPKTISFVKVTLKETLSHLKPTIALFVPQISLQIYLVLNKTMLGIYGTVHDVGIFENANKMVKIVLSMVTAMGIVMLPRVANTYAKGDMKQVNEYLYSSFKFASYSAIPLMFGLMAIAPNLVPWFFGPDFVDATTVIIVLCPIILWIAWSNVLGTQYLMAINKTTLFTVSVTVGAVVNLLLNFYFIPRYFSVGAAIATFIAELAVTFTQFLIIYKNVSIRRLFDGVWKFLTSGLFMYACAYYIGALMEATVVTTIVQITVGYFIYIGLLLLLKSDIHYKICSTIMKIVLKKF